MRVLVQRVSSAAVAVEGVELARIQDGLLVLAGFTDGDDAEVAIRMGRKIANLRIFPDDRGRFQFSVCDTGGDVLAVPQFTLYGDASRGRRPDFTAALEPGAARVLFEEFVAALTKVDGIRSVSRGCFGAHMAVTLVNEGPVTLLLE